MKKEIIYGIDFGTSNSLLSASIDKVPCPPIPLDDHHLEKSILRSLMYIPKKGKAYFGHQAIEKYTEEEGEGRFIRSIKKYLPKQSFKGTQINGKVYTLENIVSRFLAEMKTRADAHFGQEVDSVILGRPAKYSQNPEEDTLAEKRMRSAAELAGFKHIEFLPEPLAAAYDFRKSLKEEKIVLMVDLGGGTSDFTIIRLHPKLWTQDDVLSLGGISVAGDDLDGAIMEKKIAIHFGSEVRYKFPFSDNFLTMPPSLRLHLSSPADIVQLSRSDIMSFLTEVKKCKLNNEDDERMEQLFDLIQENLGFALFDHIEKLKIDVCSKTQGFFHFETESILVDEEYSREEFENHIYSKTEKIFACLDEVIQQASLKTQQIDLICCTGGTSKVPLVQQKLIERFGEEKINTYSSFQSVIQGLAEKATQNH
ncbi:MAG: Hsp70 family protein [Bdellovibrionales bacterium]|nr:Hsp70 family protein [Bdellovibrionales bacterium]